MKDGGYVVPPELMMDLIAGWWDEYLTKRRGRDYVVQLRRMVIQRIRAQ